MAVTVTVVEVKNGFTTTVPDVEIQMLIDFVDAGADACLDANAVPDNTVKVLKLNAVRHMCAMQANSGRGDVNNERAPSGAGRSFNSWNTEDGLQSTPYGSLLQQMDKYSCITTVLENDSTFDLFAIGCDRGPL